MRRHNFLYTGIFSIACIMLLSTFTNGCAKPESVKPRIAFVMKSLANEFFKTMEARALWEGRAL